MATLKLDQLKTGGHTDTLSAGYKRRPRKELGVVLKISLSNSCVDALPKPLSFVLPARHIVTKWKRTRVRRETGIEAPAQR
jgi:hypothetical protein